MKHKIIYLCYILLFYSQVMIVRSFSDSKHLHVEKKEEEAAIKASIFEKSLPYKDEAASAQAYSDRPLVLYLYFETENARENALFFINHGLHAYADFLFVLNGPTDLEQFIPTDLVNIQYIKRNNSCYDLGAAGEVLRADNRKLFNAYKRFIILNASIRGPFLPSWSTECWSDAYLKHVTEKVKLVGMSYDCGGYLCFVQSMILVTDKVGMDLFLTGNTLNMHNRSKSNFEFDPLSRIGLSSCYNEKIGALSAEVSLTNLLISKDYESTVLLTSVSSSQSYQTYTNNGDFLHPNTYYGFDVHPYETIFFKANREIAPELIKDLTDWHNESGYSSWKVCKSSTSQKSM